jgi:hypothetical protein
MTTAVQVSAFPDWHAALSGVPNVWLNDSVLCPFEKNSRKDSWNQTPSRFPRASKSFCHKNFSRRTKFQQYFTWNFGHLVWCIYFWGSCSHGWHIWRLELLVRVLNIERGHICNQTLAIAIWRLFWFCGGNLVQPGERLCVCVRVCVYVCLCVRGMLVERIFCRSSQFFIAILTFRILLVCITSNEFRPWQCMLFGARSGLPW